MEYFLFFISHSRSTFSSDVGRRILLCKMQNSKALNWSLLFNTYFFFKQLPAYELIRQVCTEDIMVISNRFKCAASLVIGLIIQKGGCFNSHTTQPFRRLSSKPSKFHQVSSHFADYASTRRPVSSLKQSEGSSEDQGVSDSLSPVARKFLGGVSFLGMIETGYLTYSKLTSTQPQFCYFSGSCSDVLDGPYSSVGPIPLSAFGFLGMYFMLFQSFSCKEEKA